MLARVLILLVILAVAESCIQHTDCESCTRVSTRVRFKIISCRWCPFKSTCHTEGTTYHGCGDYEVALTSQCVNATQLVIRYDSQVAEQLAKWSSLAYLNPIYYDLKSIQSAVMTQFNGRYEVVEFLLVDCEWQVLKNKRTCAAVIAKSLTENIIIIAFKGSFPPTEINGPHEIISYTDLKTFQPTGGKIMEYSKKTHDILFPCVKATLQRLLTSQPTAAVLITGHSDGGAQAQLAGARLRAEERVSNAKLHIYTFGSPRVGDADFAYSYNRLVGNSWRVTRREDFTPLTVSKDNYPFFHHTRREIYYHYSGVMKPSSDYEICKSNWEESGCIEWQGRLLAKSSTRNSNQYFVPDLQSYMKGMVVKGLNHLHGYMNMDCRVMPIGRSID